MQASIDTDTNQDEAAFKTQKDTDSKDLLTQGNDDQPQFN